MNSSRSQRFYADTLDRIGSSGSYINSREVTMRFRLEPGHYLIIPSTYEEDKTCEFLLRILTEQEVKGSALEEHKSEELNESESFFEALDVDEKLGSWDAFF